MAQKTDRRTDRERQGTRKRAQAGPIKRKSCFFCKDKVDEIDYKNVNQLRRYISEKGKIRNRRITGACRRHQRQVAVAVKRAREMARSFEQAQEMAEILQKTVLRFEVKAGPTGSLFGSVTPTQIADELWRTRKIRVDRRKIELDVIKRIGRYEVPIELFQDVRVELKTLVVPEGGELPSDAELVALEAQERAEQETAQAQAQVGEGDLEAVLAEEDAAAEPEAEPEETPAAEPETA